MPFPFDTRNKSQRPTVPGERLAIWAWDALPKLTPRGAKPRGVTRLIG